MDTVDLTLRMCSNPLDLTLRLGLPLPDNCDQNPILDDHFPHNDNIVFLSPHTLQAMYQLGMVNQGAMIQGQEGFDGTQYALLWNHMVNQGAMVQGQEGFHGTQCALLWNNMVSNINQMNSTSAFNQFSCPSIGLPSYEINRYINITPTGFHSRRYHLLLEMSSVPMNNYTLIDVPTRRMIASPMSHQLELGIAYASAANFHSASGGLPSEGRIIDVGPNKRCTNINCNTNDTPIWRKGPLGPKTLCNACGLQYGKEERKRKAREAAQAARAVRHELMRNRRMQEN